MARRNAARHRAVEHARLLLVMSLDPQAIGSRIAALREGKGWTQLDLAYKAKVSPSSISRWERGILPPMRELIRLAGILGVDATKLIEGDEPDESQSAAEKRLSALEAQVEAVRQQNDLLLDLVREIRGDDEASPQGHSG